MGLLSTSYINPGKLVNTNMMTLCRNIFYPYYDNYYKSVSTVPFSDLCWAQKCGEGLMTNNASNTNKILQDNDVQNIGTNYRYISEGTIGNLFSFYYFLQQSIPGADHYDLADSEVITALNNIGSACDIYCGIKTKIQSPWWSDMLPNWGTDMMDYGNDPDDEYYWNPYDVINNDCTFGFSFGIISAGVKQIGLAFNSPSGNNYPVPEHITNGEYRTYDVFVAYPKCVKKIRITNNLGMGWYTNTIDIEGYQYNGYSYYTFEWAAGNGADDNTSSSAYYILRDCDVTAMYIDPPLQTTYNTFSGWIS